jgi:hypothetical protein
MGKAGNVLILIFLGLAVSSLFATIPSPVLYFSFEKTFSPEILNTRYFFDPNPKIFGDVEIVNKDGDYCLYFDGESFLRFKTPDLLDYDSFSVSLWVVPKYIAPFNRNNWDNITTLFSIRTNNDFPEWSFALYKLKGEIYAFVFYVSKNNTIIGWDFQITKDLLDDNWHNFVFTKTPDTIEFYLDGKSGGRVSLRTDEKFQNYVRSDYLCLGGSTRSALNSKFKGYMDDFAVWDKILTEKQVRNIFNYGGIGKNEPGTIEFDIEKAKAKLREAYNQGKISYEQLKKALNEINSNNPSKLLLDFVNGIISVDDFAILY